MYKIVLAIRFLLKRRISYFAVAAIALCVFVVFVVITVLSGISANFKNHVYQSAGDCIVNTRSLVGFPYYDDFIKILKKEQIVEATSPVIRNYALISVISSSPRLVSSYGNWTREIMGIDPITYSEVTGFGQWIRYNKNDVKNVFKPDYEPNLPGCVPGIGFLFSRNSEGVYKTTDGLVSAGFEVSCIPLTAKGALAKAGAGEFSSKTFYYSDHFHSGYSADWRLFYLPFEDAQALCGMATGLKRANAIHIKFAPDVGLKAGCGRVKGLWNDFLKAKAGKKHANLLEKVKIQDWKNYSRQIVALVETQQVMMIFCFAMIGVITVFIVFVVFYMIVSHKSKDIGILKSIGVSNGNVLLLFLYFAFLVGISGSAIGALAGWRFLVHINTIEDWMFRHFEFQIWNRKISSIGDIPNAIDLEILGVIILSALAASLFGAMLPSRRAARLKPVDTLQVNQL